MNILVTGGAGYIGSVAVRVLRDAGHTVSVLDNLSEGHRDSIPQDVAFFAGDVGEFDTVIPADEAIDAVIHLGALISAGESMEKAPHYWQQNVVQTSQLLEALRRRGIRKLVFASSAAVYGNPLETPILETASTSPTNIYGATKLAMDHAITIESETYGLAAASLRFFNVAGAYEDAGERHPTETHLIPLALEAAAGKRPYLSLFGTDYDTKDGTCVRDYIHVADLAHAMNLALSTLQSGKHVIYNLGNGNGFTNNEVLKTVKEVTGVDFAVHEEARRAGDPAVLVASSEKAKQELGWIPKTPDLQTIVEDAWRFYQTQNS